jgi:hypothetical protein
MVMLPPLGWSSLRDQTHTVLVTAVTAGTWWVLVGLVRRRARRYALLGLMLALGMLSKYNFALFAAALAWRRWACRRCARCCWRAGCGSRRRWRWCWWCRMRCGCWPLARDGARHHRQDGAAAPGRLARRPGRAGADPAGDPAAVALLAAWAFRGAWLRRPPAGALAAVPWAWPLLARYLALVLAAFVGMVVLAA